MRVSLIPRRLALYLAATLVWCSGHAMAGEYFEELYGLKEVRAERWSVVAGKVVAQRRGKRALEIDVLLDRHWGPPRGGQAGEQKTFVIYPGVTLTDPRKSVIDRRLRNGLPSAESGTRVVVIPRQGGEVELLLASAATEHRLDILYSADPRAMLLQEDDAALRVELADADLADLARAELARRGKLDVATLIAGESTSFATYFRALPLAEQTRIVEQATALAKADPKLRDRLAPILLESPRRELVASLAPFVGLYDFRAKADELPLDHFRITLLVLAANPAPLDLSAFVEFLAGVMRYRPGYRAFDDDYEKLTTRLDTAARAKLGVELVAHSGEGSQVGEPGGVDVVMLEQGARLVEASPSAAAASALTGLDPTKSLGSRDNQTAMDALLRVAIAVGKAHPSERVTLRGIIEPWLARKAPASPAQLATYRRVFGSARE